MKQKYTISVAGMELSILSDGTSESVETVVATLDRRIREIFLKSPRISKNEAALLCALNYCSEYTQQSERLAAMEARAIKAEKELEALRRASGRAVEKEPKIKEAPAEPVSTRFETDAEPKESTATVTGEDGQIALADVPAGAPEENPVRRERSKKNKRVGNMFDLLTFRDSDD